MAKKAAAVEPEPAEETVRDYTKYAAKPPTALQTFFAAWLKEKVNLTFGSKKEEAAFDEGVRLGVALRIPLQASPEWKQAQEEARLAAEEAAETAPAPAPAKKATKAAKKAAAPASAADDDVVTVGGSGNTAATKPRRSGARKAAGEKVAPF